MLLSCPGRGSPRVVGYEHVVGQERVVGQETTLILSLECAGSRPTFVVMPVNTKNGAAQRCNTCSPVDAVDEMDRSSLASVSS